MFDYYMKSQTEQFSFIRIPKMLITEETFESLSIQAKLLYFLIILSQFIIFIHNELKIGWNGNLSSSSPV